MEFKSTFTIFCASAILFAASLLYNGVLLFSSGHHVSKGEVSAVPSREAGKGGGGKVMPLTTEKPWKELTNFFAPGRGMEVPTRWNKTGLENVTTGDFSDTFTLSGTIYSENKNLRRAIIFIKATKKEKGYLEGESVLNNIRIMSVRRKSVVISSGGKLIEVKTATTSPDRVKGARRTPARVRQGQKNSEKGVKVARLSETSFAVDKDTVDYLTGNINKIITKVRIIPYFESGEPAGFRLAAIRPGSTFSKLGFLPGDVIKQVNGILLTSPEKIYTIFQNLQDERKINIDILRRGKKKTITYEVR